MSLTLPLACAPAQDDGASTVVAGGGGRNATPTSGGSSADPSLPSATGGSLAFPFEPLDNLDPPVDPSQAEQNLIALRIEPADTAIDLSLGQGAEVTFRALGRFEQDPTTEVDITERTVFYVPDNYLIATFPANGESRLTTRLPIDSAAPAQQGGSLTIQAQAANSNGTVTTATTTLTVRLLGALAPDPSAPEAQPPLPDSPDELFVGAPQAEGGPVLAYPNDGVLLPPNLGRLEVHFLPGSEQNTLFEIRFESPSSTIKYFTRCYSDPAEFTAGACAVQLTGSALEALASSNRGTGPVALSVRGRSDLGDITISETIELEFASERIDGAVYYWTASTPESIVRFDFGSGQAEPETFVSPQDIPDNDGSCVGCHALSRQGDKIFFSLGNSDRGELMLVSDLAVSRTAPSFYTYNGATRDLGRPLAERENRVLTGSFNPDGSEFVAVAPRNDAASDDALFIHDATTGQRTLTLPLGFTPSQPDWSPDGNSIAMTSLGAPLGRNGATISFLGGGISLIRRIADTWNTETPEVIVPAVTGKNRFNPVFLPDASLLLYSEVDQAGYSGAHVASCDQSNVTGAGRFCNGYSDPGARTWAVLPQAGAVPVALTRASQGGVADALGAVPQDGVASSALMDTFPRAAPFMIQHRGRTIAWFTVSSQRRAGLRLFFANPSVVGDPATQALLWMFALDPNRIADGEDGSYPGFFLPFQDLSTSNHMAQWTERIVSDVPPPPAPSPPPPPAPPPAPPPPSEVR